MEDELKKEIRRQFLVDWVSSASIDEIVAKLIENDERAKKIDKAIEYIKEQEDYFYNYPLVHRKYLLKILGDKE